MIQNMCPKADPGPGLRMRAPLFKTCCFVFFKFDCVIRIYLIMFTICILFTILTKKSRVFVKGHQKTNPRPKNSTGP